MIYILIFIWHGNYGHHITTSQAVEFNSLADCQTAAKEIKRQVRETSDFLPVIVCAAKGEKK